jgi:hypothetical protein
MFHSIGIKWRKEKKKESEEREVMHSVNTEVG